MGQNKFTQNDIGPAIYEQGRKKAISKDVKWLTDKKDGFVEVACPACGSKNYITCFVKYDFDFTRCRNCQTVFMNPRPTARILADFYVQSAVYRFWNDNIFPASEEPRKERVLKPRVERVMAAVDRFKIKTNCLVEVGPGFGTFCQQMKQIKRFQNIIAVEPNFSLSRSCRRRGIKTIAKAIEEVSSFNPAPDVVVAFEVIEHLFSPEDFLVNCHRIMQKNSIVAITCPNFLGFETLTLGLLSETIDYEHINMFNLASIKQLFERTGFEVLECFTPGHLDADIVRSKILSGDYHLEGQPFLKTVLIDKWEELGDAFQKFLRDNNLSSHMWLSAKKV